MFCLFTLIKYNCQSIIHRSFNIYQKRLQQVSMRLIYIIQQMRQQIQIYCLRRKDLSKLHKQIDCAAAQSLTYTLHHRFLIRAWFWWQVLMLLINLYYINQCFLWVVFSSAYYNSFAAVTIPLNAVFLSLLLLMIPLKIMMTPRLPSEITNNVTSPFRQLLFLEHYALYDYNVWSAFITVVFLISYFVDYSIAKYIHLVYVLRLVEMQSFVQIIYRKIHVRKVLRIIYHFALLFFFILYLSHFFAIIFYAIDQWLINEQYFGDPSLYPNNYYQFSSTAFSPIQMLSDTERYIMAYYFANGLVTSIAYGDIVGMNYIENAYMLILMVVSTAVMAFLLQQFVMMVEDNSFAIFEVVNKFKHLQVLMRVKRVSANLQLKIRNYIFYIQYYSKFQDPSEIVGKFNKKMQLDLYQGGYGKSMEALFAPLGLQDVRNLCQYLQQVTYQPEIDIFMPQQKIKDNIYLDKETIDSSIINPNFIYLLKGKMFQYLRWQNSSKQFQIRKDNKYFNAFQFLTQTRVRFGLRSKTIIKAVSFSHQNLYEFLNENLKLRKQIREYREQVLSNCLDRGNFQDSCQVCDGQDHSVLVCPEIHYVVGETICGAWKIGDILRICCNERRMKRRDRLKAKRIRNLKLNNANLGDESMNSVSKYAQINKQSEQYQDIAASLLLRMINNFCSQISIFPESFQPADIDSAYDQQGLNNSWSLQSVEQQQQ